MMTSRQWGADHPLRPTRRSKAHWDLRRSWRGPESPETFIMSTIFKSKVLPLQAVKMPLHQLWVETPQDCLQQANAVAMDGFNARPVLIDENAVIVDGAATYAALCSNGIEKVKVLSVGGASEKEIRTLRRAVRMLPSLNDYSDQLVDSFQNLLDAGYPIHSFIASVIELLACLLTRSENDDAILPDATDSFEVQGSSR